MTFFILDFIICKRFVCRIRAIYRHGIKKSIILVVTVAVVAVVLVLVVVQVVVVVFFITIRFVLRSLRNKSFIKWLYNREEKYSRVVIARGQSCIFLRPLTYCDTKLFGD